MASPWLSWLARAVRRTLHGARQSVLASWLLYKSNPTAAMLLLIMGVLGLAVVLRVAKPYSVVVVSPFEVPTGATKILSVTGRTVTNMLADELETHTRVANDFANQYSFMSTHPSSTRELRVRTPIDIPDFEVEVGGLSVQRIIAEWNRIRQQQDTIMGGVIFSDEKLTLRARIAGRGSWETEPFPATSEGLKAACSNLAIKLLSDVHPEIAGLDYQSREEYDKAEAVYRGWSHREPKNAVPLRELGTMYSDIGQFDEAIEAYQNSLELAPASPDTLYDLGQVFDDTGQFGKAVECFEKALRIKPKEVDFLISLGLSHFHQGHSTDAIRYYEKAQGLRPDFAIIHYDLALAFENAGRNEDAKQEFSATQRLDPSFHKTLNANGLRYAKEGKFDIAIWSYQKALQLKPEFAEAHYNLGLALRKVKQETEAQSEFEIAHKLDPHLNAPETRPK